MSGISDLATLLLSLHPQLLPAKYVFCTVRGQLADYVKLDPVATFVESEGLTLVLEKSKALDANLSFNGVFRQITLSVHSNLEAVGLTAAVSTKLAEGGISANVIAAYYHDHIFVPADRAGEALSALQEFHR
jgi:uncharacterized protein